MEIESLPFGESIATRQVAVVLPLPAQIMSDLSTQGRFIPVGSSRDTAAVGRIMDQHVMILV